MSIGLVDREVGNVVLAVAPDPTVLANPTLTCPKIAGTNIAVLDANGHIQATLSGSTAGAVNVVKMRSRGGTTWVNVGSRIGDGAVELIPPSSGSFDVVVKSSMA